MSGRCCQGQTPSRDIPGPGKCLTLPDGAPLPPGDYSTTPGGTVFGTTPGGEHRAGDSGEGHRREGGRGWAGGGESCPLYREENREPRPGPGQPRCRCRDRPQGPAGSGPASPCSLINSDLRYLLFSLAVSNPRGFFLYF